MDDHGRIEGKTKKTNRQWHDHRITSMKLGFHRAPNLIFCYLQTSEKKWNSKFLLENEFPVARRELGYCSQKYV